VPQLELSPELEIAREKLSTQLDELFQLRPLPAVAMKIMKACRAKNVKVRELVQMIECDTTISARILSVVNSSVYGYSREVVSMNQAVVVMGFKNLSELAVSIASAKVFSEGEVARQPRQALYHHSLGCAATCRLLASRAEFQADAGSAFLAGMLHDVGKLVLFDVAPDGYAEMHGQDVEKTLIQREQDAFEIDHTQLGAKFGDTWGLPPTIVTAISNHHSDLDASADSLCRVTQLANELARYWGLGQERCQTRCADTQLWIDRCGNQELEQLEAQASEQFAELKALMTS
jgi:putative nucleotidyltransferase with HDIG domain